MKKTILTTCLALTLGMASPLAPTPVLARQRADGAQPVALNRGLVAVKVSSGVFVSWRIREADGHNTTYNLYRDGTLVKGSPFSTKSNVVDTGGSASSKYKLEVVRDGVIVETQTIETVWSNQYVHIPLQTPTCTRKSATYTPNDCSAYDMDGDGEYEIIVKWDPDNSKDSASSGVTSDVFIDCYKLDGTLLWRINLGQNIRAGAHYTQFLCYDFDGDGFGEMVCKTAPGTVDGKGNYVLMGSDDASKSYVNSKGHIASGPEYLTIFDGNDGSEINTVAYQPAYGDVSTSVWGDSNCNRSDRYKACVAFLDGEHPSAVMMRGYYSGSFAGAYDFDGEKLTQRWYHKSDTKNQGTWGEGAHSVTVGDVDGDGKDEIVVGSACIDDDGTTLWRGGTGHGDALHLGDFDPDNDGLEVFMVYEESSCPYHCTLRDAKTGKILASRSKSSGDTGRGMIFDCDDLHEGSEFMTSGESGLFTCKSKEICPWQQGTVSSSSINYRIYWDGDLLDEYHDRQHIDKWDSQYQSFGRQATLYNMGGASSINSSKYNPNLQADILGDWREEAIYWVTESDGTQALTIFTTVAESDYGLPTLRDDHVYDMAIAWQNVGYNQPPHLGYSPMERFTVRKTAEAGDEWIAFYSPYKMALPDGVEAYYISNYTKTGVNDTVEVRQLESSYIPAATPTILKVPASTAAETYTFRPTTDATAVTLKSNFLRGVAYSSVIASAPEGTAKGEFFYELRNDPVLGPGFFLISSDGQTLADNTSYLRVKDTSSYTHLPYYLLSASQYGGTESAIERLTVDPTASRTEVRDLMGRRVTSPSRGHIYVVNGQKVVW
jgi:rhamnogalacturonan endolyase